MEEMSRRCGGIVRGICALLMGVMGCADVIRVEVVYCAMLEREA